MALRITRNLGDLIAAWLATHGIARPASIYELTRHSVLSPPGIPNPDNRRPITPPPIWPPPGPPPIIPLIPPPEPGGEPEAPGEPPGWGRMEPGMERALSLGSLGLGLVGSPLGMGLGALAGISRAIGGPPEPNPYAGVPSLAQIEQALARTPQHAPGMMAERQAVTESLERMAAMMQSAAMRSYREGERTVGEDPLGGWDPGGWDRGIGIEGGLGGGMAGVGGPAGMAGGEPGGEGMGGGDGDGIGGGDGDGIGGSSGEGPGMFARGGVRIFRRPTKITAGEAGREVGIFIPQRMLRPGIQGPERSVLKALETLAKQLRRGKASDKQRNPKGGT